MTKLNNKYDSIIFLWLDNRIIGYTNTLNEADYICKLNDNLMWSYGPDQQDKKNYQLMNIHSIIDFLN
jgi:hypothetical protein